MRLCSPPGVTRICTSGSPLWKDGRSRDEVEVGHVTGST